jgi:hypothetical protein
MPLVDESALLTKTREPAFLLSKPPFLQSLDLDDHTILDDHADLAVVDPLDGHPHVFQPEALGGGRLVDTPVIVSRMCFLRHTDLVTIGRTRLDPALAGPLAHASRRPQMSGVIITGRKPSVKRYIDNSDRIT